MHSCCHDWGPAPAAARALILPWVEGNPDVDMTALDGDYGTSKDDVAHYQQFLGAVLAAEHGVTYRSRIAPDATAALLRAKELPGGAVPVELVLLRQKRRQEQRSASASAAPSAPARGKSTVVDPLREIVRYESFPCILAALESAPMWSLHAFNAAFVLEARRDAVLARAARPGGAPDADADPAEPASAAERAAAEQANVTRYRRPRSWLQRSARNCGLWQQGRALAQSLRLTH